MTGIVHCILTPEGPRFRLWSTSSKRYLTTPLSEAELIQVWYPMQVTPFISRMTMVEALVGMEGVARGSYGRIAKAEYVGRYSNRYEIEVRWNEGRETAHTICSWVSEDEKIRILGHLRDESIESRIARSIQTGTSALDQDFRDLAAWSREG